MRSDVVDNASRRRTADLSPTEFPEVDLVGGRRTSGSPPPRTRIREAARRTCSCSTPTRALTEGRSIALLELMEERPEVGICGCRLERQDGSLDHAARRSFPTLLSALGHFTGVGRPRERRGSPALPRACVRRAGRRRQRRLHADPAPRARGGRPVRRGLLDVHGGPRPLLPLRRAGGWVTWYEPSVTVVHVKGGSSGPPRPPGSTSRSTTACTASTGRTTRRGARAECGGLRRDRAEARALAGPQQRRACDHAHMSITVVVDALQVAAGRRPASPGSWRASFVIWRTCRLNSRSRSAARVRAAHSSPRRAPRASASAPRCRAAGPAGGGSSTSSSSRRSATTLTPCSCVSATRRRFGVARGCCCA